MDEPLFDNNNKLAIRVCGDESEADSDKFPDAALGNEAGPLEDSPQGDVPVERYPGQLSDAQGVPRENVMRESLLIPELPEPSPRDYPVAFNVQ